MAKVWNVAGLKARDRLQSWRSGGYGLRHEAVPAPRPAVPRLKAADHAVLAFLVPGNAGGAAPGRDLFIPIESPEIAGLLVGPERGDGIPPGDGLQHADHRAGPNDKRLAQSRERFLQLLQAFQQEGPLTARHIRLLPKFRLGHIERQHRASGRGFGERPVVFGAQVAFEPDDLQGWSFIGHAQ